MIHQFPYSNMHDQNYDWIIRTVGEFKAKYEDFDSAINEAIARIEAQGDIEAHNLETLTETLKGVVEAAETLALSNIESQKNDSISAVQNAQNTASTAITEQTSLAIANYLSMAHIYENRLSTLIAELPADEASLLSKVLLLSKVVSGNVTQSMTWFFTQYEDGQVPDQTGVVEASEISSYAILGAAGMQISISFQEGQQTDKYIKGAMWYTGYDEQNEKYTGLTNVTFQNTPRSVRWAVPDTCYAFSIVLGTSNTKFDSVVPDVSAFWYTPNELRFENLENEVEDLKSTIESYGYTYHDITWDSTFFINSSGLKSEAGGYGNSGPITVHANETIRAYVKGLSTNVALLASTTSESPTSFTPIKVSSGSDAVWIEHTFTSDCYAYLSSRISDFTPIVCTYYNTDDLANEIMETIAMLNGFIAEFTTTPTANKYPKYTASGTIRSNDPSNSFDALILNKGLYCGVNINDSSLIVSPYDDFDTFPSNKVVGFLTSADGISHCPDGFTTGTVITLSTSSSASVFRTQIANSGSRMWIRTKYGANWSDFKEVNTIPYETIPYTLTKIYVATTGNDSTGDGTQSKPFATIYHANETITDNSEQHRYQILVADGTYTDLQTRYSGVGVTDDYQGIICKNYVEYIGNVKKPGACVISWDGATGLTNPTYNDVKMKCPFHIRGGGLTDGRHTAVRGFKIVGENLRYCMHIDTGGLGNGVDWEVTDCIFDWSGRPDITDYSLYGDGACIGTGTSNFEKGKFARCEVSNAEDITMGYQAHDTVRSAYYVGPPAFVEGADITIESCNFNGANIQFRSIYADAVTEGYDRVHLINTIGVGTFEPSPNSGVTNKWKAEIKCSNITTNNFVNDLM